MTTTTDLSAALFERLPLIDQYLAEQDVPLGQRPTQAAIDFVARYIEAVREPGQDAAAPGKPGDFLASRWFSKLYAQVHGWYRDRYGAALDNKRDDRLLGVVSIAGTMFALRVPAVRSRPGKPGKTVWIGFPDSVREDENPTGWIDAPQNLERLSPKERALAEAEAAEVAGALRFIRTNLLAVASSDAKLDGFKGGILPRLDRAAQLLLELRPEAVQQAYWELQLACEHALKALQQQQAGTFTGTHDLFLLYDGSNPMPAFERDLLKRMPRWEETNEIRYGQGGRENRVECQKCYRAALAIAAGAVRMMRKMELGRAEFEIQQPPWMTSEYVLHGPATEDR